LLAITADLIHAYEEYIEMCDEQGNAYGYNEAKRIDALTEEARRDHGLVVGGDHHGRASDERA